MRMVMTECACTVLLSPCAQNESRVEKGEEMKEVAHLDLFRLPVAYVGRLFHVVAVKKNLQHYQSGSTPENEAQWAVYRVRESVGAGRAE